MLKYMANIGHLTILNDQNQLAISVYTYNFVKP
jgi:hypothetical protein